MELKWEGKGMQKKHIIILEIKSDGMEWKWNRIRIENLWERKSVGYFKEMERKQNGNEMKFILTNQVETNFDGMEWKWN